MGDERFNRLVPLIGQDDFYKLSQSRVLVLGLGGVGSYAVEALARSGVGHLVLIDFDEIALHNINRQIQALSSTVGQKKVQVMAARVQEINPAAEVKALCQRVTPENVARFFNQPSDCVIDAIDDVPGKIALIKYCREQGIPLISAMGTGNKLDISRLRIEDISQTSVCPLCRSVRRKLREIGIENGVTVVYSDEEPLTKGLVEGERHVPASSCLVPPAACLLMASWVISTVRKK